MTRIFVVALALLWLGIAGGARAQRRAADALQEARQSERSLAFDEALSLYREAEALEPGSRAARRAAERRAYLEARRDDELGFAPLESLERMRRGEVDAARLRAFAAEVEGMPSGIVRADARFLLGESYFRRLGDGARAEAHYEALVADEDAPAELRRIAAVALAEAQAAGGEAEVALTGLEALGLDETFEARALRATLVQRRARYAALGVLGFALLALLAIARPWRALVPSVRALRPGHVAAVLYVVGVPALIAELYEPTMSEVFLIHGAFAAPLLLLSLSAGRALSERQARPLARRLSLASVLFAEAALAWLALDWSGGLSGLGM